MLRVGHGACWQATIHLFARVCEMKHLRLVAAFALFGAVALVEAQGKPAGVPPSDPPDDVIAVVCSYFPFLPFCD
jgi:hypothetical protein